MQNARELIDEAGLLIANQKWARGASLSILAIEEAGKVPLLRELLVVDSEEDLKKGWRSYRSHTKKNVLAVIKEYVEESQNNEDVRPLYDRASKDPQFIEGFKQLALYSDCLNVFRWTSPSKIVDEGLANFFFKTARAVVGTGESSMQSAPELHLWVKHMKPVWRKDFATMEKAQIACYQEANDLGILQDFQMVDDIVRLLL